MGQDLGREKWAYGRAAEFKRFAASPQQKLVQSCHCKDGWSRSKYADRETSTIYSFDFVPKSIFVNGLDLFRIGKIRLSKLTFSGWVPKMRRRPDTLPPRGMV